MRTLHLYLTRQVLLSLVMTVAVFTFVMLVGNALKEVLALVVSRQITLGMVMQAIGLLIPFVMAYVLPFGMLTAIILTFGRFSADQELTAVRASGVSLLSLVMPVLVLSLLLSGLCALFNLWIAPECRNIYKNLMFNLNQRNVSMLITEDRFIDEIPGLVLYVRKKEGNELQDIRLYRMENSVITSRTYAKSGTFTLDEQARTITFILRDSTSEERIQSDPEYESRVMGPPSPSPKMEWQPIHANQVEFGPVDLTRLFKEQRKPKLSEMTYWQLQAERASLEAQGISPVPVQVQLNRQFSFSFACFAFTLIGIPLAIRAHRRETSIGVAISLGLVLVYYTFFIVGDAFETREDLHPELIVWLPNFLFEALGGWLLWRANGRA